MAKTNAASVAALFYAEQKRMTQEKFDIKSLKSALLTPANTTIKATLFGSTVYLRRKTAGELIAYEEALDAAYGQGEVRKSSELSVQLIIDCLANPDGSAISQELLPTAAELIDAHDNPTLLAAIEVVKKHAIGKLEEAEKN